MIDLYDKKGNVILAHLCNDIENAKDYKIVDGKCYYNGKFIGEMKGEKICVEDSTLIADILFKPIQSVQSINMAFTINKDDIKFE
jgi:hypothetical protein